MAKLEGIIYKTFDHYVVLRGFAAIKDIAAISHKPEAYQRKAIDEHKQEIIKFLYEGEFRYFPEVTLACRVKDYNEFAQNIGIDNAVDRDDAKYVDGLKVLSERLPYDGYRARHANLTKNNDRDLVRVDGNHRLEPFDSDNDYLWGKLGIDKDPLEKLIVPFTIIFSEQEFGDKFEAGIFHNINFKQEPLRQEASLKIISDLNVFDDKEKLGIEYPLALELIETVKTGQFNAIPWLENNEDSSKSYYRTACLAISRLLHLQQKKLIPQLRKNKSELEATQTAHKEVKQAIDNVKEQLTTKISDAQSIELEYQDFAKMVKYKGCKFEITQLEELLELKENDKANLEYKIEHLKHKSDHLLGFVKNCTNKDVIITAMNSLTGIYRSLGDQAYGNIAFLCALIYYFILDRVQMQSFIDWAVRNGITKIIEPDDLSKDAPVNLIKMFEQIYRAKKNEIFISMQFGDSQSELIYEKIVRAVEKFNTKHKSIHLNATPIRIDRTVESSTFSIQNRILEAIKSCSLIIADLSSANINVYHEIGYAMGVAESHNMIPNMILLYKENTDHNEKKLDVDKFVGFNLRNLSQLRFRDYDQLVNGLVHRLEKHYGV